MSSPGTFYYLPPEHIESISHVLAKAFLDRKAEPIPEFSTVNRNLLESALERPRAYFGEELYPSLENKAIALFYSLIKNHAFPNGNKRRVF